jgi:xanthine dehydrogenase iron-sulfur cluster and FAD-binding subunit A
LPLRDVVAISAYGHSAVFVRPATKSIKALEGRPWKRNAAIMQVALKAAAKDEPSVSDMSRSAAFHHPADAEAAGRHREGAGGRPAARPRRQHLDGNQHFSPR